MAPNYYQDRAAHVQAIGRARHWLERLAQLAHFESVVLRTSATVRGDRRGRHGPEERKNPPRD
jgi:hypothetical protein